ncbi:MAG: alpha/beta fold hydrolase [Clostridiales bacterium]|nr:alpha/beta fold hydrolase [Clostridiales bacterium]
MHIPVLREQENAQSIVVFIHGFMGGPGQFGDLLEAAYEYGCSVQSILLPGHGGTSRDFGRYGLADWENHLQNELDKHRTFYRNIFLAGHSMGGLLALNASMQKQNRVRGVILLSTPLKLDLRPRSLLRKASLLTFPNGHAIKKAYWQAKGFSGFAVSPRWLKPVRGFDRLLRKTVLSLKYVSVPVLAVHSRYDETVSFKSADILYNGLSNTARKQLVLHKSWHSYYPPEERELVRAALLEFIGNCLGNDANCEDHKL